MWSWPRALNCFELRTLARQHMRSPLAATDVSRMYLRGGEAAARRGARAFPWPVELRASDGDLNRELGIPHLRPVEFPTRHEGREPHVPACIALYGHILTGR